MGCSTSDLRSAKVDPDQWTARLIEHFQPAEFPIVPVLNADTQKLIRDSWHLISTSEYTSEDAMFGKVTGVTFFYNTFFEQLFIRYQGFENIFSSVKSRASIIGKVMSFCMSINVNDLKVAEQRLKSIGHMHQSIVHHPFLFSIYATNLHNTIKICLQEKADILTMSAWMHTLGWVLRNLMPAYFEQYHAGGFHGIHDGAVNAAAMITDKHRTEVRDVQRNKAVRSRMGTTGTPIERPATKSRSPTGFAMEAAHAQQARATGSSAGEGGEIQTLSHEKDSKDYPAPAPRKNSGEGAFLKTSMNTKKPTVLKIDSSEPPFVGERGLASPLAAEETASLPGSVNTNPLSSASSTEKFQ